MTTLLQELDVVLGVIADDNDLTSSLNAERFLDDHAPEIRAALELQARVDAGWVLVPREPTAEMRDVLVNMLTNCHSIDESYAELLDAATNTNKESEDAS